jgi:hypothetical protein
MARHWDALQSVVYPEFNKATKISHEPMVWDAVHLIKRLRGRIEELLAEKHGYVDKCPSAEDLMREDGK